MVADNYAQQIEEIDEQTKSFISESFKTLRYLKKQTRFLQKTYL